jgi:hypothetical protein
MNVSVFLCDDGDRIEIRDACPDTSGAISCDVL